MGPSPTHNPNLTSRRLELIGLVYIYRNAIQEGIPSRRGHETASQLEYSKTTSSWWLPRWPQSETWLCVYAFHPIKNTYMISHYNLSVRIIDLVSHTTYFMCVNFIYKWRDLEFKVDSERQIFWETFHGNFIYSQSFCQKSERKPRKKYFIFYLFYF